MPNLFKEHPSAVILSILVHVLLITFFIVGLDFFGEPIESKPPVNIIKATVIDDSKVRAEAEKLKKFEQQKKLNEKKRLAALKKKQIEQLKMARLAKLKKQKAEQVDRLRAMLEDAHNEEQERLAQKAIASFTDIIRQKVERSWIQPEGNIYGLSCEVRVRLIPGGEVIDAQIAKSSGNVLFDRSVELATLKASPLPIPDEPAMFNQFRNLEFYFRPSEK